MKKMKWILPSPGGHAIVNRNFTLWRRSLICFCHFISYQSSFYLMNLPRTVATNTFNFAHICTIFFIFCNVFSKWKMSRQFIKVCALTQNIFTVIHFRIKIARHVVCRLQTLLRQIMHMFNIQRKCKRKLQTSRSRALLQK